MSATFALMLIFNGEPEKIELENRQECETALYEYYQKPVIITTTTNLAPSRMAYCINESTGHELWYVGLGCFKEGNIYYKLHNDKQPCPIIWDDPK